MKRKSLAGKTRSSPRTARKEATLQLFEGLRLELRSTAAKLEHLRGFIAHMTVHKALFDEEDTQRATEIYRDLATQFSHKQETLRAKESLYTEEIQAMQSRLERRQTVLDKSQESSQALREFPQLLSYFAEKQVALQGDLSEMENALQLA
jgi:hypothetical protein